MGNLIRLGDIDAGTVARVETTNLSDQRLIAAVQDEAGQLKLIAWDAAANGVLTARC